jgi:predicted dehydrogenase
MSPLRLALIGIGDVAERDYLPEWHRLAGLAEISIVCSRSPERARRIASEYQVPRWSTDYLEVVASDVDAVVNLTPIDSHYEITHAALEAGRHVYTEKPAALDSGHAQTLRNVAATRGLVLVCAPSIMLFPQIARVRQILASGELGLIRAARAQALAGVPPWPGYHSDPSPFFATGAGPLVDMGVYPLHVLTGLLGAVSTVAALALRSRESFTVTEGPYEGKVVAVEGEDEWQLLVSVGDCLASVEANFSTPASAAADCELRGERGAVAFSLFDVSAPISLLRSGEDDWTQVPVDHERAAGGPDHILGVRHLVECVQEGTTPIANADHAVHVLEVIEAAREAARTGRTVRVQAPGDPAFASRATAGAPS